MRKLTDFLFLTAVTFILLICVWTGYRLYLGFFGQDPVVVASIVVHPRPTTYQVLPGDTVWSIYLEYYPGHDWEEIRYKIGELNDLKNDGLRAYTVIKLPEVE